MIWLPSSRRVWLLTAAGALLILFGGGFLLSRAIEAALYTAVNAYLSERTLTLYQKTDTDGVVVTVPHLELSLIRRRLELRDVRIRYDQKVADRYVRFEADAPAIVLTGLDLSDAIWRSRFHLSGVTVHQPRISRFDQGPAESDSATHAREDAEVQADLYAAAEQGKPGSFIPAPDSVLYSVIAAWLPDEIRGGRIERIAVDGGTLASRVIRGENITTDSTAGLDFTIRGIQLDSAEHRVFEWGTLTAAAFVHATPGRGDSLRVEGATVTIAEGDTAFMVAHAWIAPEGPRHGLHAMGIRRSQAGRTLVIDSTRYAPVVDDTTYFRAARGTRSTSHRMAAFNLRLSGLDQSALRQRQFTPRTLSIDSLDVTVISDQRPPAVPKNRRLWPQRLDAIAWVTGVDSIILKAGNIRYGEIKPGQAKPGMVHFSRVRGTITNATNDSTRSGPASPAVIQAEANLFDAGPLNARIEVVVAPGPIQLRAEARLGAMPLRAFNMFVLNANGIDITDGRVHEANVWFTVKNGFAEGQLRPRYENFNLELVDKVTRKQSLGKRLKSIVAGIMTRSSNLPDKNGNLKAAPIRYVVPPTDSFWGLLWHATRTGVVKSIRE